ncbi:MAG: hypothetical protein V3V45_06555 [Candidatus Brocadiales bacterium]
MKPHFISDKQLSLVLDNLPGTLAGVCSSLADAGVSIRALSIADMCDTGELRLVLDNWKRAKAVLEEDGYDVLESEVIIAEMADRPGALADIATRLARDNINIEYVYAYYDASGGPEKGKALGVIKVSDTARALEVLGG